MKTTAIIGQEKDRLDRLLLENRLTIPRRKVLFVIDTLQTGGAEQSLLENCARFRSLQPVVCHLYAGDQLKPRFIEKGVPVHSITLQQKYGWWKAFRRLRKIVKAEEPALIVACLTRSELVSRLVGRNLGIPVVGNLVSDLYGTSYNRSLSIKARIGVACFRWINRLTAPWCKGFIANSAAIGQANAGHLNLPPRKITVIHRGRDSSRFVGHPRIVFPGKHIRFLNVGRLVSVKGQRDLLLAFHAFLQQAPDSILHIAGEGPERPALEKCIHELGLQQQVALLGNHTDIPALMQSYDCFLFASHSEGFSGAVVEAMLSGLPILASDIPANREVLSHGITGFLFPPGSVDAITRAMEWFRQNRELAHTMAAAAQTHARQHFELEQIVAKLEDHLQQLMALSS